MFKWMLVKWTLNLEALIVLLIKALWMLFSFLFLLCYCNRNKCGEGSTSSAHKMLNEVYRVLNSKGVYIMISYGQPEHRMCYLEKVFILSIILIYI